METPLLKDQHVYPTREVLKKVLGSSHVAYVVLINKIADTKYGLSVEWRFYKDGNAWLCKVCHKKKTIFWLSVWDKYFKTTFYFTDKTKSGVLQLDIKDELKETINNSKYIGKLIPLTIQVKEEMQLVDILKITEYKIGLN